MDKNTVLEISDLHTHFKSKEGTVRAVDGLSLSLYEDEVLGIVGESGCGKSVTAQSILNILPKNGKIVSGKITYFNKGQSQEITSLLPESKEMRSIRGKEISMIFQEPMTSFSPVHTIGNQIVEVVELHRDDATIDARAQAINMLELTGMPNASEIIDAYPHNLSGGMRQRAMIAMALSCHPKILIADEPTTAVDVTIQAQVLSLMLDMRNELNMSVLIITHDLGVVAETTDRVAVMYLGKVMEIATVYELFDSPKHPYTQALINSVPKTSGEITKLVPITGTVPNPYNIPTGCPFHTRCPDFIPGVCDEESPIKTNISADHQVWCFKHADEKKQEN